MKYVFILFFLMGCTYDVSECMDCESIAIAKPIEDEKPHSFVKEVPEDPDTCERSNKDIHGCYETTYNPYKDDPRPQDNIINKVNISKKVQ